jgi:hypothetical protein
MRTISINPVSSMGNSHVLVEYSIHEGSTLIQYGSHYASSASVSAHVERIENGGASAVLHFGGSSLSVDTGNYGTFIYAGLEKDLADWVNVILGQCSAPDQIP